MEKFVELLTAFCVNFAGKLLAALLILAAGKMALYLVVRFFPKGTQKHPFDPTVRQFLLHFIKIVVYVLIVICMVGTLGVELSSIITVIASAGVAISLALQGSLANLASGLMILIFKPYKMGDYIECSGHTGTVVDVGIFYTVIRAMDGKELHIPNSVLTSATVINFFPNTTNRRIDLSFTVAYGTNQDKVRQIIQAVLADDSRVLQEPVPFVRLTELQDSAMCYTVKVWTLPEDLLSVKVDLIEKITAAFYENNIEIPFPQMDVHIREKKN